MKRTFTFILTILLAGGLSSCGKTDEPHDTEKSIIKVVTKESVSTAEDEESNETEEDDQSVYMSSYSPVSICNAGNGMVAFSIENGVKQQTSWGSRTTYYTNWGYADITGKVVIFPSFASESEDAQTFNNGVLLKQSSDGTKILYNTKGEIIADFSEYDAVGDVSDGMF